MKEKLVNRIGWFASFLAMMMYTSYIDQIARNLSGVKGSVILPIATVFNCGAWVLYGFLKPKRDWLIIVCNIPGVILGVITAITAIF